MWKKLNGKKYDDTISFNKQDDDHILCVFKPHSSSAFKKNKNIFFSKMLQSVGKFTTENN